MKSLALTTEAVKFGVLVSTAAGPLFVPWRAAVMVILAFLLGVVLRLGIDTAAAVGYLWRRLAANVRYHLMVLNVGIRFLLSPALAYV